MKINLRNLFVVSAAIFSIGGNVEIHASQALQPAGRSIKSIMTTLTSDNIIGGDESSIEDLVAELETELGNASALLHRKMNADVESALIDSRNQAHAVSLEDKDALTAAIADLKAKNKAAEESVAIYSDISAIVEKANTLDDSGKAEFDKLSKDIISAYNKGTITDGSEEKAILADNIRKATKAQTSRNSNWTNAIYNPSFEQKLTHWVTEDGYKSFTREIVEENYWAGAVGTCYAARTNYGSLPIMVNLYQNIDSIQPGIYRLKCKVWTNSNGISIFAGDAGLKYTVSACDRTNTADVKTIEQIVVAWNGNRLSLGVIGELQPAESFYIDNFELEYISRDINIESELVPEDVIINKGIRDAQTKTALRFYDNPQPTQLIEVINAISDAKESAEYYKKARIYLDSCYNYMEHNNVCTKEAKDYFLSILNPYEIAYNEGSLTNKDIEDMSYQLFQNGFEGFSQQNASDESKYKKYPMLYYLSDAWTLTRKSDGVSVKADGNFMVNIWSTEVNDKALADNNSLMTTPFLEYWISGSHGATLEDASIHAKAINLEPGLYKMKILTRVANESSTVAPKDYKGVTVRVLTDYVSEGSITSHLSTKPVNICEGKICRDGNLNVVSQEYEIDSIIIRSKDNHDAHVYIDVNDANVNWVAWKNCQFVKVRDLYSEEEESDVIAEATDTIKVDLATINNDKAENATTPVVTENKDGEKYYVYEPEDATKNQTISFSIPVEIVKADNKYYVVIVLVPTEDARIRATYLSFGLKGNPHKFQDRPSVPSDEVTSVLGSYLYAGEKEEQLVYEFTSSQDIESATITISTENPDASEFTSAIGLKQVSLASSEDATAIELVEKVTDNVPAEIFTMSGVKVSSFQKGINIIRLSDGTVRKIKY